MWSTLPTVFSEIVNSVHFVVRRVIGQRVETDSALPARKHTSLSDNLFHSLTEEIIEGSTTTFALKDRKTIRLRSLLLKLYSTC